MMHHELDRAAAAIQASSAVLVTAGAGMGVDSGLPDFRGNQGFWRAYPPYAKLGLSFVDMANPRWFDADPELAWGFYGHRLALYRRTVPHEGFAILRKWIDNKADGGFVFTSNVDGQFQRAGFDGNSIVECHGALDVLQCTRDCGVGLLTADEYDPHIDEHSMRARPPLPRCPRCDALLRPNVLMFGDFGWDGAREEEQSRRFERWLSRAAGGLAIVECGAGSGVPTVRMTSERLSRALGATLIRINVREPDVPGDQIGLAMGALEALRAIDERL
jgi:NAD-dependent SIR2 family protein deacetylase